MIDFDKWRRLSIPTKPTGNYIPFVHIMDDEYGYIINLHKKFLTQDPLELSMDIIQNNNEHKQTVKQLFAEDRRLQSINKIIDKIVVNSTIVKDEE